MHIHPFNRADTTVRNHHQHRPFSPPDLHPIIPPSRSCGSYLRGTDKTKKRMEQYCIDSSGARQTQKLKTSTQHFAPCPNFCPIVHWLSNLANVSVLFNRARRTASSGPRTPSSAATCETSGTPTPKASATGLAAVISPTTCNGEE